MKYISRSVRFLPITIIVLYLVLTLFLFRFGTFSWKVDNAFYFYVLQALYIFFIWFGYYYGINKKSKKNEKWDSNRVDEKIIRRLGIIITLNLFVIIINMFRDYGLSSFNVPTLFRMLSNGLLHMGSSYGERIQRASLIGGSNVVGGMPMTLFNLVWSFIGFNSLLLGMYYFKRLGVYQKIITLISVVLTVLFYISIGTNIGVFRIMLAILIFYFLGKLCDVPKRGMSLLKKRPKLFRLSILCIVVALVFLIYFVSTLKSRGGILNWNSASFNVGGVSLNRDSFLFKVLPESMYIPAISICGYLTQGYQGMAYGLQMPWTPLFPIGSSMDLVDMFSKYVFDIANYTYPGKIELHFGWDAKVQWHTMYTWFANDFSYIGVIIVMFLIGYLLASSYKDSITTKNVFARLAFYYLALMCVFIPCNNQVFQKTHTYFAFVFVMLLWKKTIHNR